MRLNRNERMDGIRSNRNTYIEARSGASDNFYSFGNDDIQCLRRLQSMRVVCMLSLQIILNGLDDYVLYGDGGGDAETTADVRQSPWTPIHVDATDTKSLSGTKTITIVKRWISSVRACARVCVCVSVRECSSANRCKRLFQRMRDMLPFTVK